MKMGPDGRSIPWANIIPTLVDFLVDGLTMGLSFSAGAQAGFIMVVSIALEMSSVGAAVFLGMKNKGVSSVKAMMVMLFLAVSIVGSGAGAFIASKSLAGTPLFFGTLAFGVAACLWLACEDLLMEAHEHAGAEKPLVTAMFFVGFLLPVLLDKLDDES